MEQKMEPKSGDAILTTSKVKLQVKNIRQERALCKNELLKALQEVKAKRKRAIACDKRARASEVRAKKLAKKAELAACEAIIYKQVAEQSRLDGTAAQEIADTRRKLIKEITAKLRLAEQKARLDKKPDASKQRFVNTSV